jgi:Protein of unknown function (DUF1580)
MINLQNEQLVPIGQVPGLLPSRPNGRRIHISAIYRWVQRGARGRRLEAIQVGGTTYTSREALQRFAACRGEESTIFPVTSARRQRQIEAATQRVAEILRGSRPKDN